MSRFTKYLRNTISLSGHLDMEAAEAAIRKNIWFRGPNVFILACAIVIASVGLNVNSIPVIIGAMLISPVMGPVMGFGFGLGTNDTSLLVSSLKNYGIMVAISILASTVFFMISPLNLGNPTELLARTRPTIYDVLIALFGGFAAIFEMSRKEKGVVLSGVAIATALMPPLCTVGFGVATLNWSFIRGAAYLFAINSVFIALAVFLATKYLGYPSVASETHAMAQQKHRVVALILTIIIVPSIFSAVKVIRENNFIINAERFVAENKAMGASYIFDHKTNISSRPYTVEIFLAGEHLDVQTREFMLRSAEEHGLMRNQVILREDATVKGESEREVIRDIYEYYDNRIQQLNDTITRLEKELAGYRQADTTSKTAGESNAKTPSDTSFSAK